MPADVVRFVADCAALGIETVWPMVMEISRAHYVVGLADATLGPLVSAEINRIAKIEVPTSWPTAEKNRFKSLPYDLQPYIGPREAAREDQIKRLMNEVNVLRQLLPKETHGHQPNIAA